jgi:hypothetical protein
MESRERECSRKGESRTPEMKIQRSTAKVEQFLGREEGEEPKSIHRTKLLSFGTQLYYLTLERTRQSQVDLPDCTTMLSTKAPGKRRRVTELCQSCRTRKIRYGGQGPTCSTCSHRRVVCRYDPDSTTQSVPQRTLEDLNARLRYLERRLEATTSQGSTDDEVHLVVHVADIRKGAVSTDITTLRYISEMIDATDEEANLLSLQHTTPGSGQPLHPPQDPSGPTDPPRISLSHRCRPQRTDREKHEASISLVPHPFHF